MPLSSKRKAAQTAAKDCAGKKAKTATLASDGEPGSSRGPIPSARPATEITTAMHSPETTNAPEVVSESEKKKGKRKATKPPANDDATKAKYRKLAPPRPFPTVPTSVSATGPRSAHVEGKNYICVTRKTPLGAYLRRCKDVVLKAGCVLVLNRTLSMMLMQSLQT